MVIFIPFSVFAQVLKDTFQDSESEARLPSGQILLFTVQGIWGTVRDLCLIQHKPGTPSQAGRILKEAEISGHSPQSPLSSHAINTWTRPGKVAQVSCAGAILNIDVLQGIWQGKGRLQLSVCMKETENYLLLLKPSSKPALCRGLSVTGEFSFEC